MSPPFKKCHRAPDAACDFSSMTFVIVTVETDIFFFWRPHRYFPKVLQGERSAPAEEQVLQVQRSGNSWRYLQMYCSRFQAGEESLGQNEVYLSDVCEVFWGDWVTLSVCHRTDECAQLQRPGKLPACCLHTKSTFWNGMVLRQTCQILPFFLVCMKEKNVISLWCQWRSTFCSIFTCTSLFT